MAHRAFTDSSGVVWEVWEVHPGAADSGGAAGAAGAASAGDVESAAERRSGEERRGSGGSSRTPPPPPPPPPERRTLGERRVGVSPPMRDGWLAFQSATERRRLVPVPRGWAEDSETQLEAYCGAARVVPRSEVGPRRPPGKPGKPGKPGGTGSAGR